MGVINCNTYEVLVNENYEKLNSFIADLSPGKVFILADENTKKHCLPIFDKALNISYTLIELDSGEVHKNIRTSEAVWEALINYNADRNSLVINLGGGVIGDMGGFVASAYMRGIPFIQIPTTLLSQVDASVGGKLGIDFKGFKNLVGLFQNPNLVWVDTQFLSSLSLRELQSGFAEVIKHGLIRSSALWSTIQKPDLNFTQEEWDSIVFDNICIKRNVVNEDPREKGLRKILNFGHTIGHAIESFYLDTDSALTHGEAVAIGMICESYLSYKTDRITRKEFKTIESFIRATYKFPENLKLSHPQIMTYMANDKKNKDGQILFSLIEGIGNCTFNISIEKPMILEALKYFEKN